MYIYIYIHTPTYITKRLELHVRSMAWQGTAALTLESALALAPALSLA